jgi:hypothetical protein
VIVENLPRFVQELENGGIAHRIEDALSFFPTFNYVALSQNGQLLGKGALLNPQPGAQLIDAHLAISQSTEDLDPQWMSKSLEELGCEC